MPDRTAPTEGVRITPGAPSPRALPPSAQLAASYIVFIGYTDEDGNAQVRQEFRRVRP